MAEAQGKGRPVVSIVHANYLVEQLYDEPTLEKIRQIADLRINPARQRTTADEVARLLEGADVAVTSWGCPCLDEDVLASAGSLRLVVHAAGTVKQLVSDALFDRGIRVTSGAAVIAKGVAETTLGIMITATKNILKLNEATSRGEWGEARRLCRDFCDLTVGIVGCGHVGRSVISLLRNFEVDVLVYDPYLSDEEAARMGARRTGLEELLKSSDIVSLHAPSIPETHHMINRNTLAHMRDGAILINTARGSLINEEDLVREVESGRITAWLDVTDPEPPAADHPFRRLPGVVLTPHIAGVAANGRTRLGRYALQEIERFVKGEDPLYEVRREQLPRLA